MNAIWTALLIVAGIVFGIWYAALGIKARDFMTTEASASDRSLGWLFWWSFDSSLYTEEGKKICKKGQLIAMPLLLVYAGWFVLFFIK